MRAHLMSLLRVPQFYDLDRLDLQARHPWMRRRSAASSTSCAPCPIGAEAARLGLIGERLLSKGDARGVAYSVTLYERAPGSTPCGCRPITSTGRSI